MKGPFLSHWHAVRFIGSLVYMSMWVLFVAFDMKWALWVFISITASAVAFLLLMALWLITADRSHPPLYDRGSL